MPDVSEVNCETGEVTERTFTPQEKSQRDKDVAGARQRERAESEAKAEYNQAVVAIKARASNDPDFAALVKILRI